MFVFVVQFFSYYEIDCRRNVTFLILYEMREYIPMDVDIFKDNFQRKVRLFTIRICFLNSGIVVQQEFIMGFVSLQ